MREQLIQYVELLFAGAPDAAEIKQEILQNTLDRYDDLIGQGKPPEAAYRLAIGGIGDINEILGSVPAGRAQSAPQFDPAKRIKPEYSSTPLWKKLLRAVGVFLYIICPIPLFILGNMTGLETIGLCGTLGIVAVATALMVIAGGSSRGTSEQTAERELSPRQELRKAVKTIITTVGLAAYFVISFLTGAWYITWVVFPIMAAFQGIASACLDLKESEEYRKNAVIRIVIYSLVVVLLLGILATGMGMGMFVFNTEVSTEQYTSGGDSIDAGLVTRLELDWAAGSITIETGDTDQITFTEYGNFGSDHAMVYQLKGQTLQIEYAKPAVLIGFVSAPSKDLVITVPRDWVCQELELDGAALDLNISGVRMGTLDIDGASNRVTFDGAVESIDIDGTACEITLVCTDRPKSIDMDGASCQLDLTLPADCGFVVRMDGLSCDFDSELDYSVSGGNITYGDRYCQIEVDGMSCEVSIR